jgi:hypothetical protein
MPPVFKAGTFPHSVFYTLSASQSHLEIPLSKAIRERFPRGVGLCLNINQATPSADASVEIALVDAHTCGSALQQPITVTHNDTTLIFPATPAVQSSLGLTKVSLSGLPPLSYEDFKVKLGSTFAKYGLVRDIVLYEDNISGSWFTSNGRVYLDRPESHDYLPLTPRIPLDDTTTSISFLATWPKMGVYC